MQTRLDIRPGSAPLPAANHEAAPACKQVLATALPALMHGIRATIAACLALWIAFFLQLDDPTWAGMSAVTVCQPMFGATLRKGEARLVGNISAAIFVVFLAACFPQERVGFLLGIAIWCAACGFLASLFEGFASYGAALAGYTAMTIAGHAVGSPDQTFSVAVTRASEISIGRATCKITLTA
jgi:uncharacterized membrane protein YccC